MAVRHLAPQIPVSRTGVVVNVVCPGLCTTELTRNASAPIKEHIDKLRAQFGRTAEDGSRTLLHAVVAGEESHGCFLSSCKITEWVIPADPTLILGQSEFWLTRTCDGNRERVPNWVTDEKGIEGQKRVWDLIARELETVEPGCVKKILQ